MAVSTRGRRQITVDGRRYVWYVTEDFEAAGMMALNVISHDKKFIVRYYLAEPTTSRHLVVIGQEFAGKPRGASWKRFRCPQFGTATVVTPSHVRALIEWCDTDGPTAMEVDWQGHALPR